MHFAASPKRARETVTRIPMGHHNAMAQNGGGARYVYIFSVLYQQRPSSQGLTAQAPSTSAAWRSVSQDRHRHTASWNVQLDPSHRWENTHMLSHCGRKDAAWALYGKIVW
jgi:hypothetical protein